MPTLLWRTDLGIRRELPTRPRRGWAIGKDCSHRMMARTTPGELNGTNGGDLAIGKVGILGLEIHDELAHRDRQRPVTIVSLGFGGSKEADDAVRIKGLGSAT